MAFWGIEVKPGKPYTHRFDDERGRLHVSQATLGTGSSTKKSIVQCIVGDKKPIFLCSLLPERIETSPLNLEFEEEDEVTFSVIGPCSVHLSGFFYGETEDNCGHESHDYESDSYGEDIAETDSEGDESDSDSEDEDDDFIDDDIDVFPPSPIPNSGVRIEEIIDEETPANENAVSKRSKKKNERNGYSDNNDSQQQIVVKSDPVIQVMESEDEDGFPISSPGKSKNEKLKKKTKDDPSTKIMKRKIDAILQDGDKARKTDSSVPNTEVVLNDDLNVKKKKAKANEGNPHEAGGDGKRDDIHDIQPVEAIIEDMAESLTAGKENDNKPTSERNCDISVDPVADENGSKGKKKKNKKKNKQERAADANTKQSVTTDKNGSAAVEKEDDEKDGTKPFQVRSFPNGLVVEELQMGKPDGKRASPGNRVSVRYIGKLKKNGKIFDSNVGKAPFKFRLGLGEVIKGWDVGVNGMRVGDKRRLTIPPAMGYGAKGAGGAIPPNAWLVFDVELVNVN
ncbi:hypothetical protein LguiB_003563 [Lonicera macranthoides]